jgi:uncharacterized repeat protein (TIGR03803 family)
MATGSFGGGVANKTLLFVIVSFALFSTFPAQSPAQTFTELYAFNHTGDLSDGGWPEAGVVRDTAGNLYGTTFFGGLGTACDIKVAGCGVVFKVDGSGNESVLHAFGGAEDGWNPTAGLVLDSAGNLYGTTLLGGAHGFGVVFKIDSSGNETIMHSFARGTDGANPNAGLSQDTNGNLYGTTQYGGHGCDRHGCGTVFRVSGGGEETVLYQFSGIDGASPLGGVVVDPSGNVYGTTWLGGLYGFGTVFKIDSNGHEVILHDFSATSDGANPMGSLVLDAVGNIYGTTSAGGNSYFGTLFVIDPTGNETVLYNFGGGNDGAYPYSNLILDTQGNLYGTTSQGGCCGQGTVFEFSNDTLNTLYSFSGTINGLNTDGQNPGGGVTPDANGNLYGTAVSAGSSGWGSVFEIQLSGAAAK